MDKRKLIRRCIIILCAILVMIFWILSGRNRLTYLEYENKNDSADAFIRMSSVKEEIRQEFYSPYELLTGISIKLGTFGKDNNSLWQLLLRDVETGDLLYVQEYGTRGLKDNEYSEFRFADPIKVDPDHKLEFIISPNKVSMETSLGFYRSYAAQNADVELTINGKKTPGELSFTVNGGDRDYWWIGFRIFICAFLLFVFLYICRVHDQGKKLSEDKIFLSILLGGVVFLLYCTFALCKGFCDEYDNMIGGMLIAQGKVLYRDYVTQHTPLVYYICALFTLLGAKSAEQFRLLYYCVLAVIWGLLYLRHVDWMGKVRMFILPIVAVVGMAAISGVFSTQVISDSIQALSLLVLALEFAAYYRDRKLDLSRAIVVSLSCWTAVGVAFVSAYAILWIILGVLVIEGADWYRTRTPRQNAPVVYGRLILVMLVPLAIFVLYFVCNGCLDRAFEQIYIFNTQVYSRYGMPGADFWEPIKSSFSYFSQLFSGITFEASALLQAAVMLLALICIMIECRKKQYMECIPIVLAMICSATRGYKNFHRIPAIGLAFFIIVLYGEDILKEMKSAGKVILVILGLFLSSSYLTLVCSNVLTPQQKISETDSNIVSLTYEGEDIFMDAWSEGGGSVYLMYKHRNPVNRAVYILPWYMDWYEEDTIDDLTSALPDVVLYNTEQVVIWEDGEVITHFANELADVIEDYYTRLSENPWDGWKYYVWVKK